MISSASTRQARWRRRVAGAMPWARIDSSRLDGNTTMPALPSPSSAGLSHMSKEFEEELFAPSGEFHFSCDGAFVWVGVQDVDSHSSDDGEVLWRVVLARSRVILVED